MANRTLAGWGRESYFTHGDGGASRGCGCRTLGWHVLLLVRPQTSVSARAWVGAGNNMFQLQLRAYQGGGPEGIAGHVASWGPLPRWPCKHKYKHNAVECRMTTGIYCDHAEWIFQVIPLTGAWPVPASPTLGSLPAVCLHVLIFIFTLFLKMHWVWIQTNHQVGS